MSSYLLCRESKTDSSHDTTAMNANRPSRKGLPKLTSDVPNELMRKVGIADEQLAKREAERGRQRAVRDGSSRSHSASSTSVSTISTNLSRNGSPKRTRASPPPPPREESSRKRRRSPSVSSSDSYSSSSTYSDKRSAFRDDRNTRRRRSSVSPSRRGRHMDYKPQFSRSRDNSMDHSRIARERQSMDPESDDRDRHLKERSTNGYFTREPEGFNSRSKVTNNGFDSRRRDHDRGGPDRRLPDGDRAGSGHQTRNFDGGRVPPPRDTRQRSLSPYSKRLALTQAMNLGR
ncbi:hypothetical protein MMC10_000310 [Thelotrema lepadinum]|nr:hypothetical protein [Thelotrema lepadinum]